MTVTRIPDLLVIGHVTTHIIDGKPVPGGAAYYSSITAARLGYSVSLVTRGASAHALKLLTPLVTVLNLPSENTTIFHHKYKNGKREQWITSRSEDISTDHMPTDWKHCPLVLLAPVANELPMSMSKMFPNALLGVSPQGWLRSWNADGHVIPHVWPNVSLPSNSLVVVSKDDLYEEIMPWSWLSDQTHVVRTDGALGAYIHYRDHLWHIPPFPVKVTDTTGAGDIFTTAYLVRYSETRDIKASGIFASGAASLSVKKSGLDSAPDRTLIKQQLEAHDNLKVHTHRPFMHSS